MCIRNCLIRWRILMSDVKLRQRDDNCYDLLTKLDSLLFFVSLGIFLFNTPALLALWINDCNYTDAAWVELGSGVCAAVFLLLLLERYSAVSYCRRGYPQKPSARQHIADLGPESEYPIDPLDPQQTSPTGTLMTPDEPQTSLTTRAYMEPPPPCERSGERRFTRHNPRTQTVSQSVNETEQSSEQFSVVESPHEPSACNIQSEPCHEN